MLTSIYKFLLSLSKLFEQFLLVLSEFRTQTCFSFSFTQIHILSRSSWRYLINNIKMPIHINYNLGCFCTELFEFGYQKNLLINSSLSNYVHGKPIPIRRLIRITIIEISCLLFIIRFVLLALSDNQLVRILMADITINLMNGKILCVLISIVGLIGALGVFCLQFFEYFHKLKILNYFYILAQNKSPIELGFRRLRRLILITHLMNKCILIPIYYTFNIFCICLYIISMINTYSDPKSDITLIVLIVWVIPTYLFIRMGSAVIVFCLVVCVFVVLYLSYAFIDIGNRICLESNLKNITPLMKSIDEHISAAKMVHDINEFFSILMFMEYYSASPACMFTLYLIFHKHYGIITLIFLVTLGTSFYCFFFVVNLACANISRSAKSPRVYLYKCFTRKHLSVKQKLRIINFIERLCGPDIGLYCYDLFPMNNLEFYKYCVNCILMYILFDSLFSKFTRTL